MQASFYDVVVLGTDLPPLLTGALLAKRGFRVLVLGQEEPAPTYRALDLTLPREPFTFLATHSPVARRVLAELALSQSFRRRAAAHDPIFQVALPSHRVDLPSDPEDLERELEREFPEVKRPAEDFFRGVSRLSRELDRLVGRNLTWPPETFLERREFARASGHQPFDRHGDGPDLLGELPDEHPFRMVVRAPVRFADGMDPDHTSQIRVARLFSAWMDGSATLEGGYGALQQMLLDRIGSHSGEVRASDKADRVLMRRNQANGVRLAGSGEEIGCGFVVSGDDLFASLRLLPDRSAFEETFERLGEPRPRYFRYTLNVVMAAEGVPEGMARDVFFLRDGSRPPIAENLLRLEVHPPDEKGRCLLSVEALVPRRSVEDTHGYVEGLRERVLGSLGDLVPFLGKHVILVDSPHDGRPIDHLADGCVLEPEEPWSRGPTTMKPLYGYPVSSALGVCTYPVRTPVRRFLICNRQVVPGLGMEGTFLAAWSAARIVTKSDRRKEWMRRGLWTKVEI